jgi:hypothetical protein
MHPAFCDAQQRVYLSATLGQGGELERAFGRTKIARVAIPPDWERRGTGRRLIVAPGFTDRQSPDSFITKVLANYNRALILTPSHAQACRAERLLPEGWQGISMSEAGEDLTGFITADSTALIAPNRYDGIDLPGAACSVIILEGLPSGVHLQERFLSDTVGATELLRERIRCRITQGMGRATRSRTDRAVVLVSGKQLLDFIANPENRMALRAELQAELGYAVWLSSAGHDLEEAIAEFRDGDISALDEHLREREDAADLSPPPGARALEASAPSEVLAIRAAWRGAYDEAAALSVEAASQLSGQDVKASRAVQKAMAASFALLDAADGADRAKALWAAELSRDAVAAARSTPWKPQLERAPAADTGDAGGRGPRAVDRLRRLGASGRLRTERDRARGNLSSPESRGYEEGLRHLGVMLGFESAQLDRSVPGAPDAAWRDGRLVVAFEAKSEQLDAGALSLRIVRQANTHLAWLERELEWEHVEGLTLIISPRTEVQEQAISGAGAEIFLLHPDEALELFDRAADAEEFVAARVPGLAGGEALTLIETAWRERALATPELLKALSRLHVRSLARA